MRTYVNLTVAAAALVNAIVLALVVVLLTHCGGSTDSGYGSQPSPPAPPADTTWTQSIKPLVDANCGGCHNGTTEPAFTSGAQFKASQAKAKIESGAMPKGKTLDPDVKTKLLAYLNG